MRLSTAPRGVHFASTRSEGTGHVGATPGEGKLNHESRNEHRDGSISTAHSNVRTDFRAPAFGYRLADTSGRSLITPRDFELCLEGRNRAHHRIERPANQVIGRPRSSPTKQDTHAVVGTQRGLDEEGQILPSTGTPARLALWERAARTTTGSQ